MPDIKGEELEETIRQNATLSYKLLRFVNSAYCALPRNVNSIGHVAMLIGVSRLRTGASLLMMASMDDKPRELMVTGIVRVKMCEELAAANGFSIGEQFFTVGLFSVLDAMVDSRMEDVLDKLPLSDEIVQALITHEELLGRMLDFTIAHEQGNWERLAEVGKTLKLDPPAIRKAYMNGVKWTMEITNELNT
jgi:EAL and modified HD-GYP domain-containing signal transduction protein